MGNDEIKGVENEVVESSNAESVESDNTETGEKSDVNVDDKVENLQIPFIDPTVYKFKKKKKKIKIILMAVCSTILLVYFAGVLFHALRFGTNTYINGIDVSGMSIKKAEETILDEVSEYELTVEFKNGQEIIKIDDGGLKVELADSLKSLKSNRNPFAWISDVMTDDEYTMDYSVSYEVDMLKEYISESIYMDDNNMEPSVDAKVEMIDGEVVVTPDAEGTKLDKEMVFDAICKALDSYSESVNIQENNCYIQADITAESQIIIDGAKAAEDYLSISANLDFAGYMYQIPREELSTMGYLDSHGNVQISKSNVEAYAQRLSDKYSTSYTERKFRTHDGRTILIYGGYYGWVLDPETEGVELYEALLKKSDFEKKPACEKEGYAFCEMNDIGDSYVEVDLKDQQVYLFIDGKKILDTPCVTGQVYGFNTPGGLYGVTYTALHATLKGEDYETDVTYWMPFNGDIGLHDATWRNAFGGDIYTYDGSHGCINLPYSAAGTIFEYLDEGFPVVCYWDDEVVTVQ